MIKNMISYDDIRIYADKKSLWVKLEHIPTGIIAVDSSTDDQLKNYTEALFVLMSRLEKHKDMRVESNSYRPSTKFVTYLN